MGRAPVRVRREGPNVPVTPIVAAVSGPSAFVTFDWSFTGDESNMFDFGPEGNLFHEATYSQSYRLGSSDMSPDGQPFLVIASVAITVAPTTDIPGNVLTLSARNDGVDDELVMRMTMNDLNGSEVRLVDGYPHEQTNATDGSTDAINFGYWGMWTFVPSGGYGDVTLDIEFTVGVISLFHSFMIAQWEGTVMIMPAAEEITGT